MQKFMVGGAVRDKLMGMEPKDVDYVVVGSTPAEMLAAGFQQVGADFPVFLDERGVEHALARTERKNGHGYNGFVTDHSPDVTLEADLMRRDLTINAMAMDGDTVVDPFGGQEDLRNKVLRHVSEAFAEDPVRVLRLARFRACFGRDWVVHSDTVRFVEQMVKLGELNHLTRERALAEMTKALSEPHTYLFFKTLHDFGAMEIVYPDLQFDAFRYDYGLTNASMCSAKFKYALLSVVTKDIQQFEHTMNVSIEWRKYAKMMQTIVQHLNTESTLDTLYAMDVFRNADMWEELYGECVKSSISPNYVEQLQSTYLLIKDVGFSNLTVEQQATLKGKAISEAIRTLRAKVIEDFG